jgi:integrase
MLSIAVQNRWIRRNPFREGQPLINQEEETKREIIATREQEAALLAACDEDERRTHLKPLLILAFDTGFRPIEMTSLKVRDVDFEDNCVWAVSYKGKQMKRRPFDMTARLRAAMLELCAGKKPSDPVFGFKSVKRSFATAKRLAREEGISLDGFRLYDARHTATTRLVRRGMSLEESGKLMGHSQPKTTWRYMHVDKSRRRRAAELLEQDDE